MSTVHVHVGQYVYHIFGCEVSAEERNLQACFGGLGIFDPVFQEML